ncbi:MAG TPA: hypothetical protein P5181_08475 [Dermatophilaceae bacterium]|mgnify:CR=1 FL=1|nr:hypothetical protein [Dermatophilaceae bacterium]
MSAAGSLVDAVLAVEPLLRTAPSAHNTQPAVLRVDRSRDEVIVGWDEACELPIADPTRRDLWLSLGAFLETLRIAVSRNGFGVAVDQALDTRDGRFARVVSGRHTEAGFDVEELRARRTARGRYAEPAVSAAQVAEIASAAALPVGPRLVVVPDGLIDELLPVADRWSYGSPAQVAELRSWLRLRADQPRHGEDGLTFECLGLPGWQARALDLALSPRGWGVLGRLGGPRLLAAASRIAGRGTVVALVAEPGVADDPWGTAELGGALLRTWLVAARHTLSCHPLSQLVDCPATATRLQAQTGGRVLAIFRIGRPEGPVAVPPRRPVPVREVAQTR